MKTKIFITFLIISAFSSCSEKTKTNIEPESKIPKLCFSENLGCASNFGKSSNTYDKDTLFYLLQNDTLMLTLNFLL